MSTSVVKWNEGLIIWCLTLLEIYRQHEVCCFYGCSVYHMLSYSFGSTFYHCIYDLVCILLFNFEKLYILIVMLCILLVMHVPFSVFCFIVLFCVLLV